MQRPVPVVGCGLNGMTSRYVSEHNAHVVVASRVADFVGGLLGAIALSAGAGTHTMEIQFEFDTMDSGYNDQTGWLIDDCNGCLITAGHCTSSSLQVVQFNYPLSSSSGSPQRGQATGRSRRSGGAMP